MAFRFIVEGRGGLIEDHYLGIAQYHARNGEALTLVETVGNQLDSGNDLENTCVEAARRLRLLIDEANAIATGELPEKPAQSAAAGKENGQAAVDAVFGANLGPFDP